jgi:hypothetical protein
MLPLGLSIVLVFATLLVLIAGVLAYMGARFGQFLFWGVLLVLLAAAAADSKALHSRHGSTTDERAVDWAPTRALRRGGSLIQAARRRRCSARALPRSSTASIHPDSRGRHRRDAASSPGNRTGRRG